MDVGKHEHCSQLRQVVNATLYVAEHGCKWRGLPKPRILRTMARVALADPALDP